ncbi:MAG TPA: FAD-dependent thymidylate synthase [Anaerolineaceae bacterium]
MGKPVDWCQLVDCSPHAEENVLAAALYRFGGMDYSSAYAAVSSLDGPARARLASGLLGKLGRFDTPLRELEYATYTFDLTVDQGGYFEIKRHRMMTQTPQALTARLGYAIPRRIEAAGLLTPYQAAMDAAGEFYDQLAAFNPHTASYVVPNGFHRRVLISMNLRSAFHFCQLRSAANAHFSVRRAAQRMADEIRRVTPGLAAFMDVNPAETWLGIEQQYFVRP